MNATGLVRRGTASAQDERGFTRAGVIGTLIVLVVAASCIRLGLWQLDRLEQRQARNALADARMRQPPVDVAGLGDDTAGAAYRRIRVSGSCVGDYIILASRSRHGAPGVHLLCHFRTDGGRDVLLDRGWLPSADARTVEPSRLGAPPRDTTVEALAIPFPEGEARTAVGVTTPVLEDVGGGVELAEPTPRAIYRLNRAQAVAVTGVPLGAWYAQAVGPDDAFPIPADPPDLGEGPHLGYAVQWFSFAAIALIGWLVIVGRRRPRPAGTKQPD